MELVALAKALWRRRLLVSFGLVVALLLVVKTMAKPRPAPAATAWTRVIVDTAESQLVSPAPDGMDSLIWRAHLLADQMTAETYVKQIAGRAGVAVEDLRVQEPLLYTSTVPTPLAVAAQKAASVVGEKYVVTLQYAWNLPVIEVDTVAPNLAMASKLAKAASDTIGASATPSAAAVTASGPTQFDSTAAQDGKLPADQELVQRFTARPAAAIHTRLVPARSGRMKGIMMAVALLLVWCITVPLLPGRRTPRRRRRARAQTA